MSLLSGDIVAEEDPEVQECRSSHAQLARKRSANAAGQAKINANDRMKIFVMFISATLRRKIFVSMGSTPHRVSQMACNASASPARASRSSLGNKAGQPTSLFCLNRNATFAPKAHIRSAPWPVSLSICGVMRDGPLNSSPLESKDATFSGNRRFRANYTVSFALPLFAGATDCLS
jgi:hypothetical protein